MWCRSCAKNVHTLNMDGKICCPRCGRVLDEDNFSQEPTFVKNAAGQSTLSGNFVRTIQNEYSLSREWILHQAKKGIETLIYVLGIGGGDSILRPALNLYKMALEFNFTRGRRKAQVEAVCLYIACRENQKPYLLIDFSKYLRINVYVLGAVFLQLCKLLNLEEHPMVKKPVDPSLFIHRFADSIFGVKKSSISGMALHIVASMNRDWMQTGRKPSGLCGAALYIAALSHGIECSKNEIIKVVHVCETTLTKRVMEFENTESGGLTIEEFTAKAEELAQQEKSSKSLDIGVKPFGCEHKGTGVPHFAHGLCERCYEGVLVQFGGLEGGSEPPAFQRAETKRLMAKEAAAAKSNDLDSSILLGSADIQSKPLSSDKPNGTKDVNESEVPEPAMPGISGATLQQEDIDESNNDGARTVDADLEEPETLSDIDDSEVDIYLHSEKETELKTIIWENMNKEYIEEQAAKEAEKRAYEEALANRPEDVQKLAAALAKSKKEKREKRAAELKSLGPAQTAADATKQMLNRKRLSSKINYDLLEKLFEDENPEKATKMQKTGEEEEAAGEEHHGTDDYNSYHEENGGENHGIDDYNSYHDYADQEHDYGYGYDDDDDGTIY